MAPYYGTVYHVIKGTEGPWGYLNVRSMTFFKSKAWHLRKTAFRVIAYSLNYKYFSVCDVYFYGLMFK